jgi:exopolysaccharide biosynthesis polyprenyl glycosylphosphotransferase
MYESVIDIRDVVVHEAALDIDRQAKPTYGAGLLKAYVVAADLAAIVLGMLAAYMLSRAVHPFDVRGANPHNMVIGAVTLPLWVGTYARYRLYSARCVATRLEELGRLVHATMTATLAMAAVAFLTREDVSRAWLILCFPAVLISSTVEREAVRATFNNLRRSGRTLRSVVLVGANAEAESIRHLIEDSPVLGYRVVGVVDDDGTRELNQRAVLGRVADTLEVVRTTGATGVIVATTAVSAVSSNRLVRQLVDAGIHVEMSSSLRDIDSERLTVRPLGSCPVVYIEPVHRGGWRAAAKRTFDVVCSGLALLLLAPFLALVAAAVKLDSRGKVFFSQIRVGKDGQPFRVHKVRTMVHNAEDLLFDLRASNEADGPLFKLADDPRVTRVGRLLRRFSVDEIPQLWNVVRGEMSLVGPRPGLFTEMSEWTPELRDSRLRVRPGVTGMWQVNGRSNLKFADYVRLDLYYVDNWSLWRDLAIVTKTIPVVLRKHGAY